MRFSKAALAALMAALLAISAAAQGDLLGGLGAEVEGALDSAIGAVSGAVETAVDEIDTVMDDVVDGGDDDDVNDYDNLLALIQNKTGNDTSKIASLVAKIAALPEAADLVELVTSANATGTFFVPRDAELTPEMVAELETLADAEPAALIEALKYHYVPGKTIATLEEFTDGEQLITLQGTPITIGKSAASTTGKPLLKTSSGQSVQVYQYNLKAGEMAVYTIKGLLRPGVPAAAPAPARR